MDILTAFYKWLMNLFIGFNTTGDVQVDPTVKFIEGIKTEGYTYNDIRDWYERTWTTNEGKESIIEAFKQDDEGWKKVMIGYGDRVFYEERVNNED